MFQRRFVTALAAGALVFSLGACGDDDDEADTTSSTTAPSTTESTSATGNPGSSEVTVTVENFTYSPTELTVAVGTTVTWVFDDSARHDVVADDGSFRSELLNGGATYKFTFTEAGTFTYLCSVHPFMTGSVTVQ